MNLCIFIISVVRPAGTRNPPEIRGCGCGCGCRNAPAGLLAGGFFPIPRVCLRAGFRQTRTRTRGCHPYLWMDEPCNADGDFLIVPQKGSKSSSSDYLPLVFNVFFCNYFSEKGDVSIFGSTDMALFWHNDCVAVGM